MTRLHEEQAEWADAPVEWAEAEPKSTDSGADIMTDWDLTLMGPVRAHGGGAVFFVCARRGLLLLTLLLSAPLTSRAQEDTPYADGVFMVNIKFPMDYPTRHPDVKFSTKVWHPSVNADGSTCIPEIKEDWTISMRIMDIARILVELLRNPNPESPVNAEAGAQLAANPDDFNAQAAQWTADFAQ
jgi:ubiquitin-conjugating enzyme E2 D/E